MFLKSLVITAGKKVIRSILFKKGVNLIVDTTPDTDEKSSGNGVGKTTVLKLIDFCLGGDGKAIYTDEETNQVYALVKNFLIDKEVLITLTLTEDLDDEHARKVVIERNFLSRNKKIQKIDGDQLTSEEFEQKLGDIVLSTYVKKPSFRQVISHNIRYKDQAINNTLKTLDKFTSDVEYETLYLFLFGCDTSQGHLRQEILSKIRQEESFKARLEKNQTKNVIEATLAIIGREIDSLNEKKETDFGARSNFEAELRELNNVKESMSAVGAEIGHLTIKRNLIVEARDELSLRKTGLDKQRLRTIYMQAATGIEKLQKTFEELVDYHNKMIDEKVRFIIEDLPALEIAINTKRRELSALLIEEQRLGERVRHSDFFDRFEHIVSELNEKYRFKGEYEGTLKQINEVEKSIAVQARLLEEIDENLFSEAFNQKVKDQLAKFNVHFSSVSLDLYGEQFAVSHDVISKNGRQIYKFKSFNTNFSSGRKQGEITCFDVAYILFADQEGIPCLHFLLYDKKELLHDNQLLRIEEYLRDRQNIQFIAAILKDKLPEQLVRKDLFVAELSPDDKVFRIESFSKG